MVCAHALLAPVLVESRLFGGRRWVGLLNWNVSLGVDCLAKGTEIEKLSVVDCQVPGYGRVRSLDEPYVAVGSEMCVVVVEVRDVFPDFVSM